MDLEHKFEGEGEENENNSGDDNENIENNYENNYNYNNVGTKQWFWKEYENIIPIKQNIRNNQNNIYYKKK